MTGLWGFPATVRGGALALLFVVMGGMAPVLAATCKPAPEPVVTLDYGSRYAGDGGDRTKLDPKADAEADKVLKPIDSFLRDLTERANSLYQPGTERGAVADCVVAQIAQWARAGALGDLQSETANLTIGARIAGFGLVLLQVLPEAQSGDDTVAVRDWMASLMQAQMIFWEEQAPPGARQGNLRAWAALAGAAASAIVGDDPVLRGWAAWSASYVLCKAEPDGSLPQEMSRGKYALKYQLHAIAPLVTASLLLERQGIALQGRCNQALSRIVQFAVDDLQTGVATEQITGKIQSFFDGSDKLEGFHLAWAEAYLVLDPAAGIGNLEKLMRKYRPLSYSKLGGDQALLWKNLP